MSARPRARSRESEPGSRRNQKIAILVIGVGLAAFAIGYGITALAFTSGGAPADVVLVPDVREMSVEDAARRMDASGLEMEVGDSIANPEVALGAILAQSPLPGQEVSPGTVVRVIVSTGQPRPLVPDVHAMPLSLATRALEAAGFEVFVEEVPGEGDPGRVIGVEPEAGTPVQLPATVVVRIGAGFSVLEMPSVIGMNEDDARQVLEDLGLRVTESMYEPSSSQAPYEVIGQDPAPGDTIEVESPVRLRVTLPSVIRSQIRVTPGSGVGARIVAEGVTR